MSPAVVNFDEDAINSAEDEEAVTTIAVRQRFGSDLNFVFSQFLCDMTCS